MLRALPRKSNARLVAPRTSTPSSTTFTALERATPRTTLLTATSRSTMFEAPERKSNPSGRGTPPPDWKRLPPAYRFVLPAMTTGFVAEPEKVPANTTGFVDA